jgi:hypothetical protein
MTCRLHAKGHGDDGHRVDVALLTCNYIRLPQTVSRRDPGLHASCAWDITPAAARPRALAAELSGQVEHAFGSCLMALGPAAGRVT